MTYHGSLDKLNMIVTSINRWLLNSSQSTCADFCTTFAFRLFTATDVVAVVIVDDDIVVVCDEL